MIARRFAFGSALAAALLLAACGGGTSPQGTARIALTDSPACGFDRVNVTIDRVRAHRSASAGEADSGWNDLRVTPSRRIELLDLRNGALEELGRLSLPPGDYAQLRLVLATGSSGSPANSVVPAGGAQTALTTPSGGTRLPHAFSVTARETVDVLIDFDACRSVFARGGGTYALKPVLRAVPRDGASITGYVDSTVSDVTVSAQKGGIVVRSTAPDSTGKFTLAFLEPAAAPYDVVLSAPGRSTAVIGAVPAGAAAATSVSTAAAPIEMPAAPTSRTASGVVTLSPSATVTEASVRAVQAVGATVVEVGFTNSSGSGSYSLSLSTAAPRLANYSTSLPLAFTAQTDAAASYTLQALAEGCSPQTRAIDLAGGSTTWNVTLSR